MATTVHTPFIGQAVYRICQPLDAGKIIDIIGKTKDGFFTQVAVKWVKVNDVSLVSTAELRDLQALFDDTQRKANTHANTLAKVKAL